jgi:Gpi18-like mannosyltransferase
MADGLLVIVGIDCSTFIFFKIFKSSSKESFLATFVYFKFSKIFKSGSKESFLVNVFYCRF